MEEWKDIQGYEGLYQISNLGKVRSLKFHRQNIIRELQPFRNLKGYLRVELHKNNKNKIHMVHILVAQHFIPNPENKKQVNHINAIKTDNKVENLEWCTPSENIKHSWENGLQKGSAKKVEQYDTKGNFIREWENQTKAAKKLNINQGNISSCCLEKRTEAGGYVWRYKKEEI